jgi:hypothetical protein
VGPCHAVQRLSAQYQQTWGTALFCVQKWSHTQGCEKRISELLCPDKLDVLYVQVIRPVCAASQCVLRKSTLRTSLPPYKNRGLFFCFWPCWCPVDSRTMTVFVLASCMLRMRHSACTHARQVLQFTLRKVQLLALWCDCA